MIITTTLIIWDEVQWGVVKAMMGEKDLTLHNQKNFKWINFKKMVL